VCRGGLDERQTPLSFKIISLAAVTAAAAAAAGRELLISCTRVLAPTYLMKSQKYTALIQWTRVIFSPLPARVYILILNYIIYRMRAYIYKDVIQILCVCL